MAFTSGNEVVDAMGHMTLAGNVIPPEWFRYLKRSSGKPDAVAAILLSEIVTWYRPIQERDKKTGEIVGWYKKFEGDKLQIPYARLAKRFGFTKRQVSEAIHRLQDDYGAITLEFRTITTDDGFQIGNVLFIEVVPETLRRISARARQ